MSPSKKFAGPMPTEDNCSCSWGRYAREFPVEKHTLLADVFEAMVRDGFVDKLKVLIPDDAQARVFLVKVFRTTDRITCRW
jgi:hypothetical protein